MFVRLLAAIVAISCATLAARAADEENPFKNAKVGDYAIHKMTVKAGAQTFSGTTTQRVTARSEKEATIETTGSFDVNGQKMEIPKQEEKVDLTKPYDPTKFGGALPPGTDLKIEKGKEEGKEKVKAAGKEFDCVWKTYTLKVKAAGQEASGNAKTWVSKDAPLGMVKMEMTLTLANMKVVMNMELTETGNKKK